MNRYFLAALFIGFGALLAHTGASGAQENPVTAIDIALEPDATMIQHAEALAQGFSEGLLSGCDAPSTHLDGSSPLRLVSYS